jgi:hypothetical protein
MGDYTPLNAAGGSEPLTYTAGAVITGGQLVGFTAADQVSPTAGATLAFAGVAGHDALPGAPVSVHAGSGFVHDTPAAALAPPGAPVPTTNAAGGTVADGAYRVTVSYVSATGETLASSQGTVTAAGGGTSTITVPSPPASPGATGWYAYVSQPGGNTLTRQQAPGSPTNIGTGLTLTAPPTSGGAQPPATGTAGPVAIAAGQLVAAAANGGVAGGAAAGAELGVAIRAVSAAGNLRWKATRG